jgi:hypothetical protein
MTMFVIADNLMKDVTTGVVPAVNLPPVSTIPAVNLPPISTTPSVHLKLSISSQIFKQKLKGFKGTSGGTGMIHEINLK